MSRSNDIFWRAPELGERIEVPVSQGSVVCHRTGTGPAVLFVHGALANPNLWVDVVSELNTSCTCVTCDLPFGAHARAFPPEADLSPPAIAAMLAEIVEGLELAPVILAGNDTGSAFCQILLAERLDLVAGVLLTSGDALESFPPSLLKPVIPVFSIPGALPLLLAPMRLGAIRRRSTVMMMGTKRPMDPQVLDTFMLPILTDRGVRRDFKKVLRAADSRYTLQAAERFGSFTGPAVIAYSADDRVFPRRDAERLAELFPNGRLAWIEDARFLSPADRPDRIAELVRELVLAASA